MLSFEEYQEMGRQARERERQRQDLLEQVRREELKKRGINLDEQTPMKLRYDHPCTPDDGFVTVLYIIGMIVSLIFKDFLMLWFVLTIGYVKFITRHYND